MSNNALSTLHQITAIAGKLDARLPKDFKTEAARLVDLDVKAKAYGRNVRHISVPDTILDSLAAGSDPYDDEVVHEALIHAQIAEYRVGVAAALARRIDLFLANSADDVLRAFKPTVAKAGTVLEEAFEKLGNIDDLASVLSRGGDAAQVWADARKAEETLQRVLTLRKYLASVGGSGVRNPGQYQPLVIADIPGEEFVDRQFADNQFGHKMPRGWDIARNGWTFSLATTEELETRKARVLEAHGSAGVRREQAQREAFRRSHGFKTVSA